MSESAWSEQEVLDLFKGIAVVIDDDVDDTESEISSIIKILKGQNIPVLTYKEIPDEKIIESFRSVSFIVLDWEFKTTEEKDLLGDDLNGVTMGDEFKSSASKTTIIPFLSSIVNSVFVPIYIFTGQTIDEVRSNLESSAILNEKDKELIRVIPKADLLSKEGLFKNLEDWIKEKSSLYALKIWEQKAIDTKNQMFKEFYRASPNWVSIISESLKADSGNDDWRQDFGDFLTRNLSSRMIDFPFKEEYMECEGAFTPEEIRKVIQGERYIKYSGETGPKGAYCGDLFLREGEYLLNIRAQCDLSRDENPNLYLIKGKRIDLGEISNKKIPKVDTQGIKVDGKKYIYEELKKNKDLRKALNSILSEEIANLNYRKGEVRENKTFAVELCIGDQLGVKFKFSDFSIESFASVKDKRIGRLLAPNIVRIQEKFSNYIVREGVMPVPKEAIF